MEMDEAQTPQPKLTLRSIVKLESILTRFQSQEP